MLDYLLNLVGRLGPWGYLVIFSDACWNQPLFQAWSSLVKVWCWWPDFLPHKGCSTSAS
jgi:hypothetical protein